MRHLILVLVIAVTPISLRAQAASIQPGQAAPRWEYGRLVLCCDDVPVRWMAGDSSVDVRRQLDKIAPGKTDMLVGMMNALGADGWELVTKDGTEFVFRRRKG